MAAKRKPACLLGEIADLFARGANAEQILRFRPSAAATARAKTLLGKLKTAKLSWEEEWELGAFEYAETLMRETKARIRAQKASS